MSIPTMHGKENEQRRAEAEATVLAPVPTGQDLLDRYLSDDSAKDRLPTREQIEQVTDREALEALRDDVLFAIKRIETDLEFSDGSNEWAGRAMMALTAHKVCLSRLDQQLRLLRRGGKKGPATTAPKDERKAVKHAAQAERLLAEAERKRVAIQAAALVASREIANVVKRTSWLAMFHAVAVRTLDATTMSRLSNEAHAALGQMLAAPLSDGPLGSLLAGDERKDNG